MTAKRKKEVIGEINARLEMKYPDAECALEYKGDSWRLLIMAILSAQCTDVRVNMVSEKLFAVFPNAEALANGNISEIERIVKPCGLYRTKSGNIKATSARLVTEFGGVLPHEMEELLTFSGVGRKVANLVRGDIYGLGGVVTDTHFMRICGRFGMYEEGLKNPLKIEKIMTPLIAEEKQSSFCHRIVWFGRETCTARAPMCEECFLSDLCPSGQKRLSSGK